MPALPGCVSQGETIEELTANIREAIVAWLDTDVRTPEPGSGEQALELAI